MRIIKKILIYSTIIGASLLSILVVFGFIYQEGIINSVKKELNKHLNAEIQVGEIQLSFISNFPLASVTLKNIVGFESKNYAVSADTLFVFTDFELSFNILEIINGNYILNEVEANNGFINLKINKGAEQNFLIFTSNSEKTSSFSLNLQKVKLSNVEIGFDDLRNTDKYRIHFIQTIAKGSFSDTRVNTALYGDVVVKKLELENTQYLTNESARVDIGLGVNLETGSFQITRGYLTLREKYKFEVKGKTNAKLFQYTFEAKELKIKNARTLIPAKHTNALRDYDLDGDLDVFLEVKRKARAKHPTISGTFTASSGEFSYKKTGQSVSISSLKGSFDLGKLATSKTTRIKISAFTLATKEAKASGEFQLYNLQRPTYKIEIKGKADLFEISKLADLGGGFGMQGIANFKIAASGKLNNIDTITPADIRSIRGSAIVYLENGAFEIEGLPEITQVNSEISIGPKDIQFAGFSASVAQSKTVGEAKLHNWLDYVLKKSKRIDISGTVETKKLDLADWSSKKNEPAEAFLLPEYLSFVGNVKIGRFISQETEFQNVRSDVTYYPKKLSVSNTYFDGFGGQVSTNSTMNEWTNGFEFKGEIVTQGIDLATVLKTYKDFGLTAINSNQLKGKLHSDFKYRFSTDHFFKLNESSVNVDGDLMLLNGEILENKLLYSIPKEIESNKVVALFVNLALFEKRLHHIKFDTLSNHITIKDKVVRIPRMVIKSSALNIAVQGTHTFDNEMDYYMNFDLNSVLGKKEPIKDAYGFIEDDEKGNRNMYVHVYTKKGKMVVDVDKFGSKKLINVNDSEEMNVAKSLLKEEFGLFKNDTTVVIPEKEEVFEYDIDLGEFSDSTIQKIDSTLLDTIKSDTGVFRKILKKKKKKKKDNFEEWNVEEEDF
ncbi:MAG: hypothetical protein ACI9GM_000786 [Salibacteraceae bacterium]|jgi:hypothetical protein